MGQTQLSYSNGNVPRNAGVSATGFAIGTITIYNNTPAQLGIFQDLPQIPATGLPGGGLVVPAFYPITLPVPGWQSFYYVTDGTAMFAASSLLILAVESPTPTSPLSPFGPSGWGAGSGPGVLTAINPGDSILAWQVNQFFQFLTGALAGALVVAGAIESTGSVAELRFYDRDGITSDFFSWYASGGVANLTSSVFAGPVLSVGEGGTTTAPKFVAIGTTATLSFQDTDQVTGDQVNLFETAGVVHLEAKLGDILTLTEAKPTVTGSRGGNAALASLLSTLATENLIIDGTSA